MYHPLRPAPAFDPSYIDRRKLSNENVFVLCFLNSLLKRVFLLEINQRGLSGLEIFHDYNSSTCIEKKDA